VYLADPKNEKNFQISFRSPIVKKDIIMGQPIRLIPNHSLRREREKRGWSQSFVAEQIGAPAASYLSRWECGITIPSPYYREKLCALFGKDSFELSFLLELDVDEKDAVISLSANNIAPSSLPLFWHMPYQRNPFFTGCEETLTRISSQWGTNTLVLNGLGGIGKTQVAIEYVYRSLANYDAVLWVRADSHEALNTDIKTIAETLHLTEQGLHEQEYCLREIKIWLERHFNWLLILDNVDDILVVRQILPSTNHGHILLTSQSQVTSTLAHSIKIEPMSPREGMLFLLRRAKLLKLDETIEDAQDHELSGAREITQLMGGLPLALDQAGAYIEEVAYSTRDYVNLYFRHHAYLLQRRGLFPLNHPDAVVTTWSLSFEKLQQINPLAANLLCLCAFLHAEAIPEELLSSGIIDIDSSIINDLLVLNEAVSALLQYSLLHRDVQAKTFGLHHLLQLVLRDTFTEQEMRRWIERAVSIVDSALPKDIFATSFSRTQHYLYQRYLPHLKSCATFILQYNIVSLEATDLLLHLGRYLCACAQYQQAELVLLRSLDLHIQLLGNENWLIAHNLSLLGMVQSKLKRM
jgi:transcriptional regulator with XRE-family HTH domain